MSFPEPPFSLNGACAVIYNGTFYSYSSKGFQSISLQKGAKPKWEILEMGVKVTGAFSCVGSDRPTNVSPAFFVVGGEQEGGSDDYTGLQKFTYSEGKWTTVKPTNLVTKHRQWHASAYIEADDSILVFGGSQDGKYGPSADTFTIKASEPYTVTSHPPKPAPNAPPPSLRPLIIPLTNSDVMVVGGGTTPEHAKVFYFNSIAGFRFSGCSFADPLQKDTTSIQGTCVTGSDNSISIVMFDLSVSPSRVFRATVRDAQGAPRVGSPFISASDSGNGPSAAKGETTLYSWPQYNSTFAPEGTRTNFAAARDSTGMMVFSGGSSNSPIAMFDTANNGWINANSYFGDKEQIDLAAPSATPSAMESSTSGTVASTPAASTNAAALSPATSEQTEDSGVSANAILGATLGSIAGFLLLVGLVLFFLRWRRRTPVHAEAGENQPPSNEKDMTAFNKGTYSPSGDLRGHRPQASAESYSSVAILMSRVNNKEKSGLSRHPSNDTARSSVSSLHKQFKSTISKPIPQETEHPAFQSQDHRGTVFPAAVTDARPKTRTNEASGVTRRSSGWNRYWSGGSALQILGFGNGNGKRTTVVSEQSSRYSDTVNNARATQDSATVPPLTFDGRPRVNSVNSGSPVVAQHPVAMPFTEGMSGTIERPVSGVSSGYSSGIPESINETWDAAEAKKPWSTDRAVGGAYNSTNPFRTTAETSDAASGGQQAPSGVSKQPQLAMASTSDMSWLNLGDASRR